MLIARLWNLPSISFFIYYIDFNVFGSNIEINWFGPQTAIYSDETAIKSEIYWVLCKSSTDAMHSY